MGNTATGVDAKAGASESGLDRPHPLVRHKRRQFLVDRRLQLRIAAEVGVFLLILAAPPVITLYVLTELIVLQRVDVTGLGALEPAAVSQIWGYAVTIFVCVVGIVFALSILLSHRIAGPVHKLRGHLDRMAAGDLGRPVRLREADQLKELADAVNRVGESWRGLVRDLREEVRHLKERPRRFKPVDLDARIASIEARLAPYEIG